jgi:hypothetical protein
VAKMVTDRGKPSEIVWEQDEKDVWRMPFSKLDSGIPPAPLEGGPLTDVVSDVMPAVPGVPDTPDLPGFYQAKWFLSPSDGLTITEARYVQANVPTDQIHRVAEAMQWRHLRLIVDRGPSPAQIIPVSLPASACTEAALMTKPGTRTADGKKIAWAATAMFQPFRLPDSSPAGVAAGIVYTVTIAQSYIFAAPAADIEPSASVVAIKVWPQMTVTVVSSDPAKFPPPSFAADLRLVFAPRLTRPDQHRPAQQFPDAGRRDTNVVSVFTDSNDLTRGLPGQGFPPAKPEWGRVFDYGEPDMATEIEFDAVVFPRSLASTNPFTIATPASTLLQCQRVGGQGEFDNVHIHPWVGLDDPSNASGTNPASPSLVEAPLAADEVMHMHWRWGLGIPLAVSDKAAPTPEAVEALRASFRGYDPQSNRPNNLNGAPLIPIDQSLRIKIAAPGHDVSEPTGGPLDRGTVVVWYSPTYHQPNNGAYTQFFGHGFACAYRFKPLSALGLTVSNADLLDDPLIAFSYHSIRWDGSGNQQITSASRAKPPGLSRNRIGTGTPPLDLSVFTP